MSSDQRVKGSESSRPENMKPPKTLDYCEKLQMLSRIPQKTEESSVFFEDLRNPQKLVRTPHHFWGIQRKIAVMRMPWNTLKKFVRILTSIMWTLARSKESHCQTKSLSMQFKTFLIFIFIKYTCYIFLFYIHEI